MSDHHAKQVHELHGALCGATGDEVIAITSRTRNRPDPNQDINRPPTTYVSRTG